MSLYLARRAHSSIPAIEGAGSATDLIVEAVGPGVCDWIKLDLAVTI
jgi:hypothetical protein